MRGATSALYSFQTISQYTYYYEKTHLNKQNYMKTVISRSDSTDNLYSIESQAADCENLGDPRTKSDLSLALGRVTRRVDASAHRQLPPRDAQGAYGERTAAYGGVRWPSILMYGYPAVFK